MIVFYAKCTNALYIFFDYIQLILKGDKSRMIILGDSSDILSIDGTKRACVLRFQNDEYFACYFCNSIIYFWTYFGNLIIHSFQNLAAAQILSCYQYFLFRPYTVYIINWIQLKYLNVIFCILRWFQKGMVYCVHELCKYLTIFSEIFSKIFSKIFSEIFFNIF